MRLKSKKYQPSAESAAFAYRKFKNRLFNFFVVILTILALIPLFLIIYHVLVNGISSISWEFLTTTEPPPGAAGGGIVNSIVGTALISFFATLIATPLAIGAGIYLAFNQKAAISEWVYLSCNALQSIPAIVVGILAYVWVVAPMGRFSLISGSIVCAIMMFPIIVISTVEVINMVSKEVIEAAYAMGGSFFSTVRKVVLPIATPALTTGVLLALARITGEAAPILFTAFGNPFLSFAPTEPVSTLPITIYKFAISPYENWQNIAWGASFILLVFIILVNFLTKLLARRKI